MFLPNKQKETYKEQLLMLPQDSTHFWRGCRLVGLSVGASEGPVPDLKASNKDFNFMSDQLQSLASPSRWFEC